MPPDDPRHNGPLNERVAKLEQRLSSHEDHCDERHQENQDRLFALEHSINAVRNLMWTLLIGVSGSVIVGLATLIGMLIHGGHQ